MKSALKIAGICAAALLLALGLLRYMFQPHYQAPVEPEELKTAKVVVGKGLFSKTSSYGNPNLGPITAIETAPQDGLWIVGQRGATLLGNDFSPLKTAQYSECPYDVMRSAIGGGTFLCRRAGPWGGAGGTVLYDGEGKTVWSFSGGETAVYDAVSGALGENAEQRVVVGLNGDGGVRLLDENGKELWKQNDGNVWHVEIIDDGEHAGNVIVHSNAGGGLTLRDASGKVLSQSKPETYVADFSLTAWGTERKANKLLVKGPDTFYILSLDGKTIAHLAAPVAAGWDATPKATPVQFRAGKPHYAALARYPMWDRSNLYIYDEQNQLVYNEVIGENCGAVSALHGKKGSEDLLLGCNGNVWRYTLADHR